MSEVKEFEEGGSTYGSEVRRSTGGGEGVHNTYVRKERKVQ